ncbi:MAG: glycosyltransferase family 1 protein, partial [Roseiflexus sp.]|nr:glycosyltransferase family 1 protein [Roseiflexus sp.]
IPVMSQQPDIASESSDVAMPAAPEEPVSLSDGAPDLPVDQLHGDEAIPAAAPERETAHPGDQSSGMDAQRQEGVEGS